jgi:hypothetical protein
VWAGRRPASSVIVPASVGVNAETMIAELG